MSRRMHREIEEELARRREAASREASRRREWIYQAFPEVEKLDRQIRQTGLELGRACLGGAENRQDALVQKLDGLRKQKEQLLSQHGFPSDYYAEAAVCPVCGDRGYVEGAQGLVRCNCYKQLLIRKLMQESNVPEKSEGFKGFDLRYYPDVPDKEKYGIAGSPRKHMADVLERCRLFVESFADPQVRNLVFIGKAGLGKTYLCNCISLALLQQGIPVLYLTAPMLFQGLTISYGLPEEERESARELREMILQAELLIIDDLGTEKQTATRYAELLEVLNSRDLTGRGRPCKTVISTNLNPKNIFDYYGERVASRILGGFDVLRFVGEDIRLLQKH